MMKRRSRLDGAFCLPGQNLWQCIYRAQKFSKKARHFTPASGVDRQQVTRACTLVHPFLPAL